MLPGTIGLLMATETLKWLLGVGEPLRDRLLLYDSLAPAFRSMKLRQAPDCMLCGEHPSLFTLAEACVDIAQAVRAAEALPSASSSSGEDQMRPNNASNNAPNEAPGDDTNGSWEISPTELQQRLVSENRPLLVDVRDAFEWAINHLDGARWVPLKKIPGGLDDVDREQSICLYCHRGVRSLQALYVLRAQGFRNLCSLAGGIDAWARQIDRSMPRY